MLRLFLVSLLAAAACGRSAPTAPTLPVRHLLSIDGRLLPVELHHDLTNGQVGSIVGGTISPATLYDDGEVPSCSFRLSLFRAQPGVPSGTSEAVGNATCAWSQDGTTSAVIGLGQDWGGQHTFEFSE